MPSGEIELRPVDFLTVGTVGPRGQRVFYLQGAQEDELVTLRLEKVQVSALSEAITELLDDLNDRYPIVGEEPEVNLLDWETDLRDPVEPEFRVAQIGLGFDEAADLVVLVTQELVVPEEERAAEADEPRVARFWASRALMRALSVYAEHVVAKGRPDPQQNGRINYYWT